MSSTSDKFVLIKGLDNVFTFVIKQQGSTLPMTIDDSDTFVGHLYNLSTGLEVGISITIAVESAIGGKITVTFGDVSTLESDKGTKVDRYYLKPTHKLLLDCNTVNNGKFIAKLPYVYVD